MSNQKIKIEITQAELELLIKSLKTQLEQSFYTETPLAGQAAILDLKVFLGRTLEAQ
jgi:hypothetical protein